MSAETDNLSNSDFVDKMGCQKERMKARLAYPRTCRKCGFGPCKLGHANDWPMNENQPAPPSAKLEDDLKAAKNAPVVAPLPGGAWVCPKCQRIYGPTHLQCYPCNEKIAAKLTQAGFHYGPWAG
jgi:hypothetical protein